MSSGLTHIRAIARGLAYAPAPAPRVWRRDETGELAEARATRPGPAGANPAGVRQQIREQVLAERGVDLLDLYRMAPQERIRTETAVMTETAVRARQASTRETANFIDLRV